MANQPIQLHKATAALELLEKPDFQKQWDDLYQHCPWATVFQSRQYAATWYKLYQEYTALLIVEWADNQLVGLIPLAVSPSGNLMAAGSGQAEYQGWLATSGHSKNFILNLCSLLQREYPNKPLHLKYTNHRVPVGELQQDAKLKHHVSVKPYQQPIMKTDVDWLNAELKKKNRKEKINRLKRLGNLTFEKVDSYESFASMLDDLIIQADFRKGAMYGEEFFALDKHKKDFMLQLFQQGLLHVTLLKLNEEVIAANCGVFGKGTVFLQGLNSHSPFHAKHSPGIIRFLMLGLQMNSEGLAEFDLTPGGTDGYKTDLANSFYQAHELVIGNAAYIRKFNRANKLKNLYKKYFPKGIAGIAKKDDWRKAQAQFKKQYKSWMKFGPSEYSRKNAWLAEPNKNFSSVSIERPKQQANNESFKKNNLRDLLLFDESASVITRRDFLSNTMKRLEFGHQVYTFTSLGKLKACLWFVPKDAKIEHPSLTKAESAFCFPTILNKTDQKELQPFFTDSVIDIFKTMEGETLTLKINKGYFSAEQLFDSLRLNLKKSS